MHQVGSTHPQYHGSTSPIHIPARVLDRIAYCFNVPKGTVVPCTRLACDVTPRNVAGGEKGHINLASAKVRLQPPSIHIARAKG